MPAIFDINIEIHDRARGSRDLIIISSTTLWDELKDTLSEGFNFHPTTLHAQWRLSGEGKGALLFDLCDANGLKAIINLIAPFHAVTYLANGKVSGRKKKIPTVQITNMTGSTESASAGNNKACSDFLNSL